MNDMESDKPTTDNTPTDRLLETYRSYPEAQRRILQVLSVIYQPINQTRLQNVLSILRWQTPDGQPLAGIMAKPFREKVLADGLVSREKNGLRCHPYIVEVLTREAVTAGVFQAIVRAAEAVLPSKEDRFASSQKRDFLRIRRLRIAVYGGNDPKQLERFGLKGWSFTTADSEVLRTLVNICNRPFDRQWFDGLPPTLRFQVLASQLEESASYLNDPGGAWQLIVDYFAASPPHPEVAFFLADQWLYRGVPERAEALLPDDGSSRALSRLGWVRFLQGETTEAIQRYQAALKAEGRRTRKRNLYITGLSGVCFVLALLRSGDPSHRDLARKQILMAAKVANDDRFSAVFSLLGDLLSVLAGEINVDQSAWLQREPLSIEPWLDLFRCLALHWLGVKPRPRQIANLPGYCRSAATAGLMWYARESALLLKSLRRGGDCTVTAAKAAKDPAFHPITDLIRPEAPWERALRALKGIREGSPDGVEAATSDLRMTWRLSCYSSGCILEPREQKRGKRGGWSKGRAVSLERLYADEDTFDYLSPQDRRICRRIEAETVYEYFGRYPRTQYSLDSDQALLEAVGHPLLFWADAPEQLVELVQGEPVLEVHRRKTRLQLRLQPYPSPSSNLLPQRESERRLRLVAFNAQHRRIAEILGESGLSIPLKAKAQVLESIAAIAPLLTIHSDIGAGAGTEATPVTADPRPHIHLRPVAEGLALECYTRPFGEAGPLFHPGKGRTTLFAEIGGKSLQTTRDTRAEKSAATRVLEQCPELDPNAEWSWELEEPEAALGTLLQLQELGEAVSLEWPQGQKIRLTPSLGLSQMQISLRKQRDWFALEGELRLADDQVLSMRELLNLLEQSPGRFVQLKEGEFLSLTGELRRRLEALHAISDKGRFHPLATPAIDEITAGMEVKAARSWREQLARLAEARELQPGIPSTLRAELRDYQQEGFRWLARLAHWGAGACLADDMGLGKTVQALALILSRTSTGPTLVLAPTSVGMNWLVEATRFAPTLRPQRFGPGDRQRMLDEAGPFDLIVCSYGLLQTESERLTGVTWSTVVADEAQAIKNTLTKRSRAAMALQAGFRMITTGTPIENHLGELWNLFRFINPGLLGSLERFNQRFAIPIEQHQDRAASQRLKQLIRPFILRRLKRDVLTELPSRTEITLHVELSDEETALYEAMRQQAIERIQDATLPPGQQRVKILAEIMRLRRACCNPRLVLPDTPIRSSKMEAFIEILQELRENRHKALVFSQFIGHLALIREHLDKHGISYQYLDGSTPIKRRTAAIDAFQAGEGELFLISLKAGGSGLNLTAADYVIHMDPWWNPAVEDQASDRAHRIGQQRPVTIYRLVARNTIEDKIVQLHAHKRELADNLLEGSEMSGRMSMDEIVSLLREDGVE